MKTFRVLFHVPPKCLEPYKYYNFSSLQLSLLYEALDIKEALKKITEFALREGMIIQSIEELL